MSKKKKNGSIEKIKIELDEKLYYEKNPIWKKIIFDGKEIHYSVSNTGLVRNDNTNYLLNPRKNESGYLRIGLCINGKPKTVKVHRLVAQAFIPNPENKREVNHIDGDKTNNYVGNLEWTTSKENKQHAIKNGYYDYASFHTHGIERSNAIYTDEQVHQCCKLLAEGKTPTEVAHIMKISKQLPSHIKYLEKWKHISSQYNIPKPKRVSNSPATKSERNIIDELIRQGNSTRSILSKLKWEYNSKNVNYIYNRIFYIRHRHSRK